jgi:hypothetical protein
MKQLTNEQSEQLSAFAELKLKYREQANKASATKTLLDNQEKLIKKFLTAKQKRVSNGEFDVSFKAKRRNGYVVENKMVRYYTIVKIEADYANVSKGGD